MTIKLRVNTFALLLHFNGMIKRIPTAPHTVQASKHDASALAMVSPGNNEMSVLMKCFRMAAYSDQLTYMYVL